MLANPSRRLPGPPVARGQWCCCLRRGKDSGIPFQPGGPSASTTSSAVGTEIIIPPRRWVFSYDRRSLPTPTQSRPFSGQADSVGSVPAGGQTALCNSRPQFLRGRWTELCGLQFLLVTKANAIFTYLPRRTFFCISLCGLGSLEI